MFTTITIEGILYFGAFSLSIIGLFGLLVSQNIFRMLLALVMFEAGANLILVLSGFIRDGIAPIFIDGNQASVMNDPVPQALVLTAIVIGVGVQALALALIIRVKKHYGSMDMRTIRSQLEREIAADAGVVPPGSNEAPATVLQLKNNGGNENE
ncbi:MAG TPA: Na+/H+ antiporter subunit C [Oceanospirillales bacterium]|nr:Na+/H+ antiporter subunit C [Oceanospirillales bacterium]